MYFEAFPKIPRLFREMVITEKIDGTNAAVLIEDIGEAAADDIPLAPSDVLHEGRVYHVAAQSRKRVIFPNQDGLASDNFGFAGWVRENQEALVQLLGPGRHFGEWWGQGIQRGYGLDHKRFSLFNPEFHFGELANESGGVPAILDQVGTVPVLYRGPFDTQDVRDAVDQLAQVGSFAAPGFKRPEGIIVWHEAARQTFKVTVEHDEAPKGSIHWGGDGV